VLYLYDGMENGGVSTAVLESIDNSAKKQYYDHLLYIKQKVIDALTVD
jgi:hypothetical protein